jgi:hypothetical protein
MAQRLACSCSGWASAVVQLTISLLFGPGDFSFGWLAGWLAGMYIFKRRGCILSAKTLKVFVLWAWCGLRSYLEPRGHHVDTNVPI